MNQTQSLQPSTAQNRPAFFAADNREGIHLPFLDQEYLNRLHGLRTRMAALDIDTVLLTSMHNMAYYSGFLYCSFGRPYGCVITQDQCVTVSANIDFNQPARRSYGDNIIYTDWQQNNYWRAIKHVTGSVSRLGIECDHLTLKHQQDLNDFLDSPELVDVAATTMQQRMIKSPAEIDLITASAQIADIGGQAIRDAIRVDATELEVACAGRNALEAAIAQRYPDAEYRDTWVWFQSGINTDGAHNPVTQRKIVAGDILILNAFPMISGYYTALERTLFAQHCDDASLKFWQANVDAHELGLSLIKLGARCSDICTEINAHFKSLNLLQYRTFGYGHSFGVLSHYYGREAGLELREDNDTVLEAGMVVSMEPMLTISEGLPGAGGYREHDIVVVGENDAVNITGFPYGPDANIVG